MELILYKTESADNVINKTLSNPVTMNINLRRGVDISYPVLKLQVGFDLSGYNYAHIPELERYYFIREVQSVTFDVWELRLACDVVETYKAEVLQASAAFRKTIEAGDYGSVNLELTGVEEITNYQSDVELVEGTTTILSVMGVK